MTQKEFKKWVSELPEENDDFQVVYTDKYEDNVLVEDYLVQTYTEWGEVIKYINLWGYKILCY